MLEAGRQAGSRHRDVQSAADACMHSMQVGYFHGYLDGVDYVFVDHACFQGRQGDIYGGDRQSIQFRCGHSAP